MTKLAKSLENNFPRMMEVGISLAIELAWRDLEHDAARRWLRRKQRFASVSRWEACGVSRDPSCI